MFANIKDEIHKQSTEGTKYSEETTFSLEKVRLISLSFKYSLFEQQVWNFFSRRKLRIIKYTFIWSKFVATS